jgi:L-threonylcarbamoyladenylate synthase
LELSFIEKTVGKVYVTSHSSSNPKSPGMLKSHYSPTKPFVLGNLNELIKTYSEEGIDFGVLSFDKLFPQVSTSRQIVLSPSGDLGEAAKNLFAGMRILDRLDVSVILAELLPERGLGFAINDRLKRAAAK